MTTILNDTNEDLATLAHFGVLGMKWGHTRARATASQIHGARGRVNQANKALIREQDRADRLKSPAERRAASKKVKEHTIDFLKNPDRVTASRMTRGEKVISTLLLGPIGIAAIGATSAKSRRVEQKQLLGLYDKKK